MITLTEKGRIGVLNKIVFSERAMTSLLMETLERISTETGGVFLGYRTNEIWYVIEAVDPGPNSIFRTSYFEYDQAYINHLINKISRLYSKQLELIGLWHRHPGSFDKFSSTDDITNQKYASLHEKGSISALVNIDPLFRLTVYEVTLPTKYRSVEYTVGDDNIPQEMLSYNAIESLTEMISSNVNEVDKAIKLSNQEIVKRALSMKELSFEIALNGYLLKRRFDDAITREISAVSEWEEGKLECLLGKLQDDLEYISTFGVEFAISINDKGYFKLTEKRADYCNFDLLFDFSEDAPIFNYQGSTYIYQPGIFKESIVEYIRGA